MSEDVTPYLVDHAMASAPSLATLAKLSRLASENWATRQRLGGGSVIGGPDLDFARGNGQCQIASFSVPRLPENDDRDPVVIQDANADFAVGCVAYVRALLAGVAPALDSDRSPQ